MRRVLQVVLEALGILEHRVERNRHRAALPDAVESGDVLRVAVLRVEAPRDLRAGCPTTRAARRTARRGRRARRT